MAEAAQIERVKAPNWDMTPYFPEFNGAEYRSFREDLDIDVGELQAEIDDLGAIEASNLEPWAALLQRLEQVGVRTTHLGSYLGCLSAANSIVPRRPVQTASSRRGPRRARSGRGRPPSARRHSPVRA